MIQSGIRSNITPTKIVLATILVSVVAACGGGGSGGQPTGPCSRFQCTEMLSNIGSTILFPAVQSFSAQAASLTEQANTFCDSNNDNPAAAQNSAQSAWKSAMAVWQQIEVAQIGPLSDNNGALRDVIYSWPNNSTCLIDQEVVLAESEGYDISTRTPERRGLPALEYLLFSSDLNHTCAANIETVQGWNARDETDRKAARCSFVKSLVSDLELQAKSLVSQWDGSTGDFLTEFTQPGSSSSRFDSAEEAINTLSDALFYLEKQTKDVKLAQPLGLKTNACNAANITNTACPQAVESLHSQSSKENIQNNLLSFQRIFLGNSQATAGLGFDDFIDSLGGENNSATLSTELDRAISGIDNTSGSLFDAVTINYESVLAAHTSLKAVTDELKEEFLTILQLSIPDSAAGDGD